MAIVRDLMRPLVLAACALPLLGLAASATPPAEPEAEKVSAREARLAEQRAAFKIVESGADISLASYRIRHYFTDENNSLIIEANHKKYYWVDLWDVCERNLDWDWAVGFDYGASNTLDRFSTVTVDGMRCPVMSVTQVEKPDFKAIRAAKKAKRQAGSTKTVAQAG